MLKYVSEVASVFEGTQFEKKFWKFTTCGLVNSVMFLRVGVTAFIKAQPYFSLLSSRKIVLPDSDRHTRQNSGAEHNWSWNTFDISRMSVVTWKNLCHYLQGVVDVDRGPLGHFGC